MMDHTDASVHSQRLKVLAENFHDREYRHSYVATQLRTFLSDQIRALRGDMSQTAFGRLIGKPQSVISRLEDEDYGRLSLQTLLDIAERLDIAILARFVDFETFLYGTRDQSVAALLPKPYDAVRVDNYAARIDPTPDNGAALRSDNPTSGQSGHALSPWVKAANDDAAQSGINVSRGVLTSQGIQQGN